MKIPEWCGSDQQMAKLGQNHWRCSRLFQLAKDLPVMEVPLDHLNVYEIYTKLSLREMVMHMKAVQAVDLSFPIILDEDGELLDGRHRVMRALLEGRETIKAVRFDENPAPCEIKEE